jgi:hypothetical protein
VLPGTQPCVRHLHPSLVSIDGTRLCLQGKFVLDAHGVLQALFELVNVLLTPPQPIMLLPKLCPAQVRHVMIPAGSIRCYCLCIGTATQLPLSIVCIFVGDRLADT